MPWLGRDGTCADDSTSLLPSAGADSRELGSDTSGEFPSRAEQLPESHGRDAGRAPRSYDGPRLSLSAQVHTVLEPVHWLLARVGDDFVVRQIGREAGRQLREGTPVERLTVRLAGTMMDEIRDLGRWILGAALPRWGCGLQDCESGTLWTIGTPCEVCAEAVHGKSLARRRTMRLERGLYPEHGTRPAARSVTRAHEAPPKDACGALDDGLCKPCRALCRPTPEVPAHAAAEPERCPVTQGGTSCKRNALPTHGVCPSPGAAARRDRGMT
ncbi:hypothetical protein [Streptomyces formicae]|uniref:hypothetical protein n=1 Tax=Streptomyces formicae TaxID=1616117 RepID=UPI00131B8D6A|nr:hypothetical protein [Streptomyces formicae]